MKKYVENMKKYEENLWKNEEYKFLPPVIHEKKVVTDKTLKLVEVLCS